ncbi:hypothetical protein BIU82_00235 [Arthrobacter sp. SW1]|nr:hypothetical protein BIU82_00235 [Arthrobacter sp. SW1]
MSDSRTPLPTSLWGFAMSLIACAVALSVLVDVIASTWRWLLLIVGAVGLVALAIMAARWWWHRNRW